MDYRITKDIGVEWETSLDPEISAWGVSEQQLPRAQQVVLGDILLHFIDAAYAWAGYSTVTGVVKPNDRDIAEEWRVALPYVIPIKRGVWLNKGQCSLTTSLAGLSGKAYHRRKTFNRMSAADGNLIKSAIDDANGKQPTASHEFCERWNRDAERYYWDIARRVSGGKCWLCGTTAASWVDTNKKAMASISEDELKELLECFLDVAHIEDRADEGKVSPDNVRALCPNCHRIVDRIPKGRKRELLLGKKPKF